MAFNYRKKITIDHTKVGATLSNFPVLVSGTYSDLKSVGNGGQVQNASGYDLVFFSDSALTTKLKFEIVHWDSATGKIVAWVKIASLSNSVDTDIYLGVGDSGISTDQSDKANVWDSYAGVYHLADNQANTTVLDSKGANNGTNVANTSTKSVTGKIFKALSYNGSSDYSDLGNSLAFDSNNFTIEAWLRIDSPTPNGRPISYFFGGATLFENGDNFALVHVGTIDIGNLGFTRNTGNWQHVVMSRAGSDFFVIVNGNSVYTSSSLSVSFSASGQVRIGSDSGYSNSSACSVEELRLSNAGRSTDWATTAYKNQNSPATFYSFADFPFPLDADFTSPTAINFGATLSISDATTGGVGTKTRVWKIDGFTVPPANADYINPTFTWLAAGNHTVTLEVTDNSGTDSQDHDIFVGTLTGAAFVANGVTSNYSTNVPTSITWSIVSGGGSINSAGQYTAPSSGSGSAVLKALNGDRFATKTVAYAPALATTFLAGDYYLTDTDFTLTASPSGGGTPYAYEWFVNDESVGTSSTKTLNLPAGSYTVRLEITDVYGATAEHSESFLVVDNLPFSFVTTAFPAAVKDSAYSEEIEYDGGLGTPAFRVLRGALPTGMSIVDFDITGTPTVAGLYVFELEGEDDNGTKIRRWFSILVEDEEISTFTVYTSATIFRAGHADAETNPLVIREDILGFWLEYLHAADDVTFSDNGAGGEFLTPVGSLVRYKPANRTQIVTLSISDGTTTRTKTVTVYGTQPLNANWGGETTLDTETKVQKAKGGTEYLREEENTAETNQLTFTRRETYELDALRDFWLYHRKVKRFYFLDMDTGELYLVRFVSELRWQKVEGDSWTIYANVKGIYSAVRLDLTGYK